MAQYLTGHTPQGILLKPVEGVSKGIDLYKCDTPPPSATVILSALPS